LGGQVLVIMRSSAHAQISHQKAKKLYKNQDKTANNPWLHQVFGIYTWVKNRWTQKSRAWRVFLRLRAAVWHAAV
jgi:hypothetical protein